MAELTVFDRMVIKHHGDIVGAAIEIAHRLSSPDPEDEWKAPYSIENAVLSVKHAYTLSDDEAKLVTEALERMKAIA